ncbi:Fructose-2,6-bisphosphatase [Linnemannia elongata]|nr:Fructose-2,6-bisphosphatase [Linnemannia elongata]
MDLERQDNVLIIGHQAILRCLYAYFMNHSFERLPYLKIPLHTVIQLTPGAYTCEERRFKVDIEAVDTHRPKPKAGSPAVTKAAAPADPEVQALATAPEPTGRPLTDAEKPKIILSNMKTTTFRDALHPDAASVESRATSPAPAQVVATAVVPDASAPAPAPALAPAPAPALAPAPVAAPASLSQAPASIALPPVEEKAKQIAAALMQATAAAAEVDDAALSDSQDVDQYCASPIPGTGSKGVSPSSSLEQIAVVAVDNKPKKEVAVAVPASATVAAENSKEVAVPTRQPVAQVATAALI